MLIEESIEVVMIELSRLIYRLVKRKMLLRTINE